MGIQHVSRDGAASVARSCFSMKKARLDVQSAYVSISRMDPVPALLSDRRGRSVMQVPLVDLQTQYTAIKNEIDEAISKVISCCDFILGSEVKRFEEEVAAYCGARYAVGVASGTDALHLALLGCGVGPGDEVITTPFTFFATAEAIIHCGARPVFVDIEPKTYNIDPQKIEIKITNKTKIILPVHLYGQPADVHPILELAEKYNLKVIKIALRPLGQNIRIERLDP